MKRFLVLLLGAEDKGKTELKRSKLDERKAISLGFDYPDGLL